MMGMSSSNKDNANPIIHEVVRSKRHDDESNRKHVGDDDIAIYANVPSLTHEAHTKALYDITNGGGKYDKPIPSSSDRSVYMCLREIRKECTNGSSTSRDASLAECMRILKDAGFYTDETTPSSSSSSSSSSDVVQRPFFVPSNLGQEETPSKKEEEMMELEEEQEQGGRDPFDTEEIFDMVRTINDPEHPLTLEQLRVVSEEDIHVFDASCGGAATEDEEQGGEAPSSSLLSNGTATPRLSTVQILFTPTIPHCSMATLIGLCLRVKLLRSLPSRFKINVAIKPGTHDSELSINKQLADKERVAAALENKHLLGVVHKCIERLD